MKTADHADDVNTSRLPSISYSIAEADAFRSFNEILGEVGPFQIWTGFLILLSGVTVSWETLSFVFLAKEFQLTCDDPPDAEACSAECPAENVFVNSTLKGESIVLEWRLFCENAYRKQLSQTVLIGGVMFGCLFYGHIADQLGRRPTFLSACMVVLILGIIVGLSPWYWFFCLTRFIMGIGCGGMTIICVVFLVEYVDFSRREFMVIMYRLPYTLGHGSLPALAYFITHWRGLQIVTSAFAIVYVSYFWLLPESPRWLFITGQLERCIAVLRTGAKRNNRPTEKIRAIVESAYDELRSDNFSRKGTMVDLFKTRNLCKKTTILLFAWFALYLVFYGVLEYLTYMEGKFFINFGIGAWLTIPSTLVAYPVVTCIPRRYSLLITFGLSAICMLLIPLLPNKSDHVWFILLSTLVLASSSISFCIMHLYSTEIFPTILRNSGMGLSICSGRFGCMLAPYVITISRNQFWVPAMIFGGFSFISTISVWFLPETQGEILPDTIEEGETFGMKIKNKRKP